MSKKWIYPNSDIFKSTHYSIDKFNYCFKLNQRVKAAAVSRSNSSDYRFLREIKGQGRYKFPMQLPPVVEKEKFQNRPCDPPFLAIRRWKIWIKNLHTRHWIKSEKCKKCRLNIKFKDSRVEEMNAMKNKLEKLNNKVEVLEEAYKIGKQSGTNHSAL